MLVPRDGRQWDKLRVLVSDREAVRKALDLLDSGTAQGISPSLEFEGPSHADCLIECEQTFIWIEGKRNDWLSPSTTWDVVRDQIAALIDPIPTGPGQVNPACPVFS